MNSLVRQHKIDELVSKSMEAISHEAWFEAERLASKSLMMAKESTDFGRMADIIPILKKIRSHRIETAFATRKLRMIDTPVTEDTKILRGCYLVRPPQVGADARRLRLAALHREIPIVALCHEPQTILKQVPIVMITPGLTLRTRIDPPRNLKRPSLEWFAEAVEELGAWAIASLDAELAPSRRVDSLFERLDAIPEHENLHLALEAACREAHEEAMAEKKEAAS